MENLMNVSFGKVSSARLPITGENGVYKVKANLTFNESKEITNADGNVSIVVSNAEVAREIYKEGVVELTDEQCKMILGYTSPYPYIVQKAFKEVLE